MAAAEALKITRVIDNKVNDVDDKVERVDDRVKGVDHKVGSVIEGELRLLYLALGSPKLCTRLDVKETGVAIRRVENRVSSLNRSSSLNLAAINHASLGSLTGKELRKDLRKWISPPDPSVNYNTACKAHHGDTASWCTQGDTFADWKASGSLLWIHGKRTYIFD